MQLATRSLVSRLIPIVFLLGTNASAQGVAPGAYKGQTTQGDPITINVAQNKITSWSSAYTCDGSQFQVAVTPPVNSCPIVSSGNFQCGNTDPACGMATITGAAVGDNMMVGALSAKTPDCLCFQVATFSVDLSVAPSGNCGTSATNLCLSSRFKVAATWVTPTASGTAQAVPLTDGTGYLWFFTADEVELVVKIVNGCALNQHFWVFAAGLTDVHVVLSITDTTTNAVKTYNNKQGTLYAPIADTSAFSSCP